MEPNCSSENQEMEALAHWVSLNTGRYPQLAYLYHIPNGGYRHPITAKRFKRQLVRKGVPDLFLPYPVDKYHGLWIELKTLKGKCTPEQKYWIAEMNKLGYAAKIVYGWKNAVDIIVDYLHGYV